MRVGAEALQRFEVTNFESGFAAAVNMSAMANTMQLARTTCSTTLACSMPINIFDW